MLHRYFDVFLYSGGTASRWGMLRFPTKRIELDRWRPYLASWRKASSSIGCASLAALREFTVLTMSPPDTALKLGSFVSQDADDASDDLNEDACWPLPLAIVRADLLAG
ncbi:MAG: hypothetical protein M3081_20360, partial [Gemmatimonadota bacterium]|nr:hypothetical protein [Gemmatimonadota bacterium]